MKIVLVNYNAGKPNPVYETLAEAFRRRGHTVIVGTLDEEGSLRWEGSGNELIARIPASKRPSWVGSLPIVPALYGRWERLRTMFAIRAQVGQLQPDQVQVNTASWPWLLSHRMPAGTYSALDIRQINEAVDLRRRSIMRERWRTLRMRVWARRLFDLTFFCHVEAAKHVVGEDWAEHAAVVPVGVDEGFLQFPSSDLVQAAQNQIVKMVYIGTLSRLRTLEQLILAADLLRSETSAFKLTLAGPDRTNGYLQSVIERLGVGDVVEIVPALSYEQVPGFLAQHHVGLAYVPDRPTWHYQPTIKVLEYRALGLPIISTDVLSHRPFVQDGVNGVMVQDTPESIAAGMRRFVVDRQFLQHVSDNAREMRQGLTWDHIAEMYEQVYRQQRLGRIS